MEGRGRPRFQRMRNPGSIVVTHQVVEEGMLVGGFLRRRSRGLRSNRRRGLRSNRQRGLGWSRVRNGSHRRNRRSRRSRDRRQARRRLNDRRLKFSLLDGLDSRPAQLHEMLTESGKPRADHAGPVDPDA